jgi:A/G-specific adenine glycosylase
MTYQGVKRFQATIWEYYQASGRKLPWRNIKSPYRILVSEIMLQQTQVSRVLVKYKEFIKKFSSFRALADASVPEVLAAWQGMGYNRRALCLKKLAEIVVCDHGGNLPQDYHSLLALPGIGPGTAGSLSAFVFNLPVPFIETNIRRVYIHFFFPLRDSVSDKELMPMIERTIDRENPREWYYALMDYGAMLGRQAKLENPNRKSAHYTKQSKFEGSKRQLRGKILRAMLARGVAKPILRKNLEKELGKTSETLDGIIDGLIKEGFLTGRGKSIMLV